MAFYFPSPATDGAQARNPASGVTYTYRDRFSAWVIESSGGGGGTPNVIAEDEPKPVDEFPIGSIWYQPSAEQLYIQNNNVWEECAPSALELDALASKVDVNETVLNNEIGHRISGDELLKPQVSDSPPDDPIPNLTLWFDTVDLELLLYYNDGDSSQWVPCSIPLSQSPDFRSLKTEVERLHSLPQTTAEIQQKLRSGEERMALLESNPVPDVDQSYVDKADHALSAEIQGLKDRVQELEKSSGAGNWRLRLDGDVSRGDLMLYKKGFTGGVIEWADIVLIGFDLTDLDNRAHKMDQVTVGDVIRLDGGETSQATLQIVEIKSIGIYEVKLQSSKAKPVNEQKYKVDMLSSIDPSKLATLSFVTQQLEILSTRLSKLER